MQLRNAALSALTICTWALGSTGCGAAQRPVDSGATAAPAEGEALGVEQAALPFRILRGNGGQEITVDEFYGELSAASGVCLGESHNNPHDHWAQLEVLDKLTAAGGGAVMLGLGMEMFQRPFQGVLDDFSAGRIDEKALLSRTGWEERWGYDFGLYRPMVRLAVERKVNLVALNAARELVKKVSKEGHESLGEADTAKLPELELADKDHRAWWDNIMASMGGGSGHGHGDNNPHHDQAAMTERANRMYAVQVLWDETMADTAVRWLKGGGERKIVILAGNGHCHTSAIVRRMQRRGAGEVVSVRPIVDDGEGNVAEELATPIHDYLFVMTRSK